MAALFGRSKKADVAPPAPDEGQEDQVFLETEDGRPVKPAAPVQLTSGIFDQQSLKQISQYIADHRINAAFNAATKKVDVLYC